MFRIKISGFSVTYFTTCSTYSQSVNTPVNVESCTDHTETHENNTFDLCQTGRPYNINCKTHTG